MKKSICTLAVVVMVVGGTLMAKSPVCRTFIWERIHQVTQWTPEAIQKDPIAYMKFVEKKLAKDQNKIQETWRNLGVSVGKLAKKQSGKRELLERGTTFAEEFRDVYQNANGNFPVEVQGQTYTEAQIRSQLSLLLAQNDGLAESLSEIDIAMNNANSKMEELVVQKEKTESQLFLIATKRELFQAESLSTEGLLLIAQLNELFDGNEQVIAGNPVRTIEQLVQAEKVSSVPANSVRVDEFLNAKKPTKPIDTIIEVVEITAEIVSEEIVSFETPKKVNKNRRSNKSDSQPIYQQSQPIYQQSI